MEPFQECSTIATSTLTAPETRTPVQAPIPPRKSGKFWSVAKRISRSAFLYIVALLAISDAFLTFYVPKQSLLWYEKAINGCNEPFCRKIFEYICSQPNPQVLMLGSSLLAVPSISCDHAFVKVQGPFLTVPDMFDFSHYKRCDYFKMLLSQKLGQKVEVTNLGVAGIVASDQQKILEKSFAYEKKPNMIVWTIAPAEFIWNDGRGMDDTRISVSFKSYQWPFNANPSLLAADKVRREVSWHFDLLQNELAAYKTPLGDKFKEMIHRVDPPQERPDLPNPAEGVISKMDAYGRQNRLEDIPNFNLNYAKANDKVLTQQLESFKKAMTLCAQNNVPVVLVNMPITSYNRALIKKPLYNRYINEVTEIAAQNKAQFINMDDAKVFDLSDFYDSTHLNENGGKKLFVAVSDRIAKSRMTVADKAPSQAL